MLRLKGSQCRLYRIYVCISYYGGSTHTDLALSTARNAVLTSSRGARDAATKTVILLTDGQSFNTRATELQVLSRPKWRWIHEDGPINCHVLPPIVTSCYLMSRLVTYLGSCHLPQILSSTVTSCHLLSCPVTCCHILSHHILSCPVTSNHVTHCHVLSPIVTSCHITSCHSLSRPALVLTHLVTYCHVLSSAVASFH